MSGAWEIVSKPSYGAFTFDVNSMLNENLSGTNGCHSLMLSQC